MKLNKKSLDTKISGISLLAENWIKWDLKRKNNIYHLNAITLLNSIQSTVLEAGEMYLETELINSR